MTQYAPIVLFVFNRPNHTIKTIEALMNNKIASQTKLFVYSDGAKNELDVEKVNAVRNYIKQLSGFKSIDLVERENNWGLAANIIDGVTNVVNKYGRVIVIEDDIVTSPVFLDFMNNALDYYKTEKKVYHISGWNYPIDPTDLEDVFFWRVMNCWGWATWSDRWKYFKKDTEKIFSDFNEEMIREFDLDNSGIFWKQLLNNKKGKINTWGIYWYASIFTNKGLCLHPAKTYVRNIGNDGSGIHHQAITKTKERPLNMNSEVIFNDTILESSIAVKKIIKYYKNRKNLLLKRAIIKLFFLWPYKINS